MLIEEDDDALPTRYVKARPVNFFKHELEALKQKTKFTNLDWYTVKRFYRLLAAYSVIFILNCSSRGNYCFYLWVLDWLVVDIAWLFFPYR